MNLIQKLVEKIELIKKEIEVTTEDCNSYHRMFKKAELKLITLKEVLNELEKLNSV